VSPPPPSPPPPTPPPDNAYGMLMEPGFDSWPRVIRYLNDGGRVRVLAKPFTIDGRRWPAGTLFFPRAGATDFARRIAAAGVHEAAVTVFSGRVTEGNDLGTETAHTLRAPRVALLGGDGVSAGSFGAQWFFLEQTLQLPFDQLPLDRLAAADLSRYNVIIAPDMGRTAMSERATERLKSWIQAGGTFIATGSAARGVGATLAEVKLREAPADADSVRTRRGLMGREEREIDRWEQQVPGAILTVRLDPAHPLAFGAGVSGDPSRLYALHAGAQVFEPDPAFETVGHFEAELERVSGVISQRNLDRLERGSWLVSKSMGSGRAILFIDDPVFRHFWYATFQPFANAIMIGPAM
jgi:hypothetical protein